MSEPTILPLLPAGLEVLDGGKTIPPKYVMLREFVIVVPKKVGDAIDQLYKFVADHYPTRNDFLEDLLREGLRSGLEAQMQAQAQLMMEQAQAEQAKKAAAPVPDNIADLVLAQHALPGETYGRGEAPAPPEPESC